MTTLSKWGLAALSLALAIGPAAGAAVSFTSPGFAPSTMDAQGRLVEDWGALEVQLFGAAGGDTVEVQAITLDGVVPAAQARAEQRGVRITRTAFRAPTWPAGLDVLSVRLEEVEGREQLVPLAVVLPDAVRVGAQTVSVANRAVVSLPVGARANQTRREWGWDDAAASLPGWGRPAVECDPAFANIRAGLGGVPIHYRFRVEPRASFHVVLGFCESHWEISGQRPMVCRVEGAAAQELDCIARWGQHRPGALVFTGKDADGDGELEIGVVPQPGAPDQNPILSAIWVFPADLHPDLGQVIAGKLNGQAWRYVDVGGANDPSLFVGGKVEYTVKLPARGAQEMTFLVACPGSSVPMPDQSAWTPETLRRAAVEVWREWR